MSQYIKYREGYKYQTEEDYQLQCPEIPDITQGTGNDYVFFGKSKLLVIRRGYAWDGPSGPTIDSKDSMRGSLIHDAFYQLMREGFLSIEFRENVDDVFLRILLEDGMFPLRAAAWYTGVRIGAADAANPRSNRPILTAP